MTLENTNKLIDDIIEKRKKYLQSKINRYPAKNFRASDIHECNRHMVHSILDWDKKQLYDEGLQAIFDRGNDEERLVVRDLAELGFNFIHQQTPIEIKNRAGEIICTGRIDGKIIHNGCVVAIEIKSMNMNTFNSLKSIDDFHKKPLHRKYLRQLQLYLYGNNEEAGIFMLSNLQGAYKLIPVILDYGTCEHILQRLEKCWEFVKKKEYPERMEYNESICGRCAYAHLCLPEVKNEGARFVDDDELEDRLERREQLKVAADEYDELDKDIKGRFKGYPQVFVGSSWQITGKESIVKRLDIPAIPDEIKAKFTIETPQWRCKIVKLADKGSIPAGKGSDPPASK